MAGCVICDIVSGTKVGIHNRKHILDMKGEWVLNHNDAPNAYLGYLVLTVRPHLPGWEDLSAENLAALGPNIQWVDTRLRQYWQGVFPDDPIQQVYFAYLNETGYIL